MTETVFNQDEGFVLHLDDDSESTPKLLRVTIFPANTMDFHSYEIRNETMLKSRTGNIPNTGKAIKEYLENNRNCYMFIGDTEYPNSIITLRYFEGDVQINKMPEPKDKSLIIFSMNNAYYKYMNAIDAFDRAVEKMSKKEKEERQLYTDDEIASKPVPLLDDGLMDEIYRKIEKEKQSGLI